MTRYPDDGSGYSRLDWLSGSTSTWAQRTISAPLAWGCETGDYGSIPVRIGLFEWKHQGLHPDYAYSTPQVREPSDSQLTAYEPVAISLVAEHEAHGAATTGLLSARGNNSLGIAGLMWRSQLFLYSGYGQSNRPLPVSSGFWVLAERMVADEVDVLSFSVDARLPGTARPQDVEETIRALAVELRSDLFERLLSLVVVVAAGNNRYRGTVEEYTRFPGAGLVRGALLLLRADPLLQDRILIVGGTEEGNTFWDAQSNFFSGRTDIAAPARDLTVLDRWLGQGDLAPLGGFRPQFSPTGDSVALQTTYPEGSFQRTGWDLVSVPSGTSATIREWLLEPSEACAGDCPVWYLPTARWSHGGRHLALVLPREEREGQDPPGVPLHLRKRPARVSAN